MYTSSIRSMTKKRNTLLIILITLLIVGFVSANYFYPLYKNLTQYTEVSIVLEDFSSKDNSFTIQLPKGWSLYETTQGIRSDPYVMVEDIRPGFNYPQIYIARNNFPGGDLQQVLSWGQERAKAVGEYSLISSVDHSTSEYQGVLTEYSLSYVDHPEFDVTCKEWFMMENNIGYGIAMCGKPEQWNSMNNSYFQMLDSFKVK